MLAAFEAHVHQCVRHSSSSSSTHQRHVLSPDSHALRVLGFVLYVHQERDDGGMALQSQAFQVPAFQHDANEAQIANGKAAAHTAVMRVQYTGRLAFHVH